MEIIVEFIKGFIKLCNKKDWSHLPEKRLATWGDEWTKKIEEKWDYVDDEDIIGEDESEPVDITSDIHNIRDRYEEERRQSCGDEEESEPVDITSDIHNIRDRFEEER